MNLDNYKYPIKKPQLNKDLHGWMGKGNKRLLKKYIQKNKDKNIFEFGSWLGLSTTFISENTSKDTKIYAVDLWSFGGETISNMVKTIKDKKEKKKMIHRIKNLYDLFIVNMWDYKDKLIPIKIDGRKGMQLLYDNNIKPDLIYLDMDHEYEPVLNDLKVLCKLYPDVVIIGDDPKFYIGVAKALKEILKIYPNYYLELDLNSYALIPLNYKKKNLNYSLELRYTPIKSNNGIKKYKLLIIFISNNGLKNCKEHYNKFNNKFFDDINIVYINENNSKCFNIGKLYNIGYLLNKDYTHYIFHRHRTIPDNETLNYYITDNKSPILLEYKANFYSFSAFYLGSILFEKSLFEKINGFNNIACNEYELDNSLFYSLVKNNSSVMYPSTGKIKTESFYDLNYRNLIKKINKKNIVYEFNNGLKEISEYKVDNKIEINKNCYYYNIN